MKYNQSQLREKMDQVSTKTITQVEKRIIDALAECNDSITFQTKHRSAYSQVLLFVSISENGAIIETESQKISTRGKDWNQLASELAYHLMQEIDVETTVNDVVVNFDEPVIEFFHKLSLLSAPQNNDNFVNNYCLIC